MNDITIAKARKTTKPIIVHSKGEWKRVVNIRPWGKNWMVVMSSGELIVDRTYHGLKKVTESELATLLED